MTDPINEADLHAFVDNQLDVPRRIAVEDHLARHPETAARVMADMRTRDALAAIGGLRLPPPATRVHKAARRLDRGLVWRRIGLRLRRAAAVALLIGAGWFAHAHVGLFEIADSEASPTLPAFVDDVRHSHQTALIRARMVSQPEAPDYDPAEIRAETGITLPALPGRLARRRRPDLPVSLRPQRRNCGRNRRARAGVPVRRARAVLRSDCADGRPLGRGGHGLLADRRIRLRAYWRGAGGSPGTGRFSAERQLSLTTPFVLHKERL